MFSTCAEKYKVIFCTSTLKVYKNWHLGCKCHSSLITKYFDWRIGGTKRISVTTVHLQPLSFFLSPSFLPWGAVDANEIGYLLWGKRRETRNWGRQSILCLKKTLKNGGFSPSSGHRMYYNTRSIPLYNEASIEGGEKKGKKQGRR